MGPILVCQRPRLRFVKNEMVRIVSTVMLHKRIREFYAHLGFYNVKNLAIPILLGKSFFDKLIKSIIPAAWKILTYNSQPVDVLIVYKARDDNGTRSRITGVTKASVLAVETEEEEHVPRDARATIL